MKLRRKRTRRQVNDDNDDDDAMMRIKLSRKLIKVKRKQNEKRTYQMIQTDGTHQFFDHMQLLTIFHLVSI